MDMELTMRSVVVGALILGVIVVHTSMIAMTILRTVMIALLAAHPDERARMGLSTPKLELETNRSPGPRSNLRLEAIVGFRV